MLTVETARMLTRYNAWSDKVMFDAVPRCRKGRR